MWFAIILLFSFGQCWNEYKSVYVDRKYEMAAQDVYVDPVTQNTHLILKDYSEYLYLLIDVNKKVQVLRALSPANRFYSLIDACLVVDGLQVTIVATLDNKHPGSHSVDPFYMSSEDGGYSWTDYHQIFLPGPYDTLVFRLSCPVVFVKETKRIYAIFSFTNSSDSTLPFHYGLATKTSDSKIFSNIRFISLWKGHKHHYFYESGYTILNNKVQLHVSSFGEDSILYMRSGDAGITWSQPEKIVEKAYRFSHHTFMVCHGSQIFLSYEDKYGNPISISVSSDHGSTWKTGIQFTNIAVSTPTNLKMCCVSEKCRMIHSYTCRSDTVCFDEIDLKTLERTKMDTPFLYEVNGVYGAYLACGYDSKKGEILAAFTNINDKNHHFFVISHLLNS